MGIELRGSHAEHDNSEILDTVLLTSTEPCQKKRNQTQFIRRVDGLSSNLPERSRDTIGPGNIGRLEKGGSPSPLRDDDGGGQTGLDHTPSGAVKIQNETLVRREFKE